MVYRSMVLAFLAVQGVCASCPQISNVNVDRSDPRSVRISYDLTGSDAIVTVDILTNGVSIGAQCFQSIAGDVNAKVSVGMNRKIVWNARHDWPDRHCEVNVMLKAWRMCMAPDYVVIDLLDEGKKSYYARAEDIPGTVQDILYKTDRLVLRRIHAAGIEWRMGQPATGELCEGNTDIARGPYLRDTETAHMVTFTDDFYMGVYEVTQRQYYHVTKTHPSSQKGGTLDDLYAHTATHPVEQVSYNHLRGETANDFNGWPQDGHVLASGAMLLKFREKTGLNSADLPTEAQWEFACRAGTGTSLNSGTNCAAAQVNSVDSALDPLGWYGNSYGNAGGQVTHPVGLKNPNAWGLYDMHGNVFEWTLDWLSVGDAYRSTFVADWAEGGVTVDPVGATSGESRVVRGGDYFFAATYARSACRAAIIALPSYESKHYGFRIVCSGNLD